MTMTRARLSRAVLRFINGGADTMAWAESLISVSG